MAKKPVKKAKKEEGASGRPDIKGEVIEEIISLIEGGKLFWNSGMNQMPSGLFQNGVSGRIYAPINQMLLLARGFVDTRNYGGGQLKAMGKYIKKGEKSTRLVCYVDLAKGHRMPDQISQNPDIEVGETVAENAGSRIIMVRVPIFNASQVQGLDPLMIKRPAFTASESVDQMCRALIKETGLKFEEADCIPHYSPFRDMIKMPGAASFHSLADYEGTRLHELAHATGSPKRLGRFFEPQSRDAKDYAREELLAEMSAYFLSIHLGLQPSEAVKRNHAAYLQHYAQQLRADRNMLFSVSKESMGVLEYLKGFMLSAEMSPGGGKESGKLEAPSADRPLPRNVPRM